ncbi:ABC transporter permease subunit [Goodfellowiella coeruleoviolacea]|uniref:ABC-type transport system involved in multi-copper enzyme maturation, permease component n=1 Tax=Goodfellowiella coeruleoviolacea TaxID=334858 RepID=A0AAE3KGI1_9PSEU|nr:ABC transporter permease subunit [Goodfellowiella coeruleoviolacea]MCP2167271.1 ABC-type transport system involved in multi-copper enzyme maturation, permease component [Goodfellowiella coeruleoviolacea]
MSTATPIARPTTPPARFRDLLAAEWIKLWSLRSTRWLLGVGALALIGFAAYSSVNTYLDWPTYTPREQAAYHPVSEVLTGATAALLVIGAGSVGALTVVGEYATGLIRTTLTAVPARHRVVAAKVAVVAAVMLTLGAVVTAASFGASQAILSGRQIGVSLTDPGVLRVLAADALLAPVAALVGMGLGALLRHTAAAVVAVCGVLVVVPSFLKPTVHQWANDLYATLPLYVWRNCLSQTHPRDSPALPTVTGSWVVFALWPLVAALLTLIVVTRRDV